MAVIEVSAANILFLSGGISSNIKILDAKSTLNLAHSQKSNPRIETLSNDVRFTDVAVVSYGIYNGYVVSTLTFTDRTHPRTLLGIASSYLNLSQYLVQAKYEQPAHTITFGQVVSVTKSKGIYQTLTFSHVVSLSVIRTLQVHNVLSLQSHVKPYLMDKAFTLWPPIVPPLPEDV